MSGPITSHEPTVVGRLDGTDRFGKVPGEGSLVATHSLAVAGIFDSHVWPGLHKYALSFVAQETRCLVLTSAAH